MGLDISLYSVADHAVDVAREEAYEAWHAEGPDGKSAYDSATEDERTAWYAEHRWAGREDVSSERYPDHLFKRRYLRSSYNGGGFNYAVPGMLGTDGDLYWMFEPLGRDWREGGDEEPLTTAEIDGLRQSKARALDVAAKLRESDCLAALEVDHFMATATDRDSALAGFRAQVGKFTSSDGFGWYSNRNGWFFPKEPPTILAAIPGKGILGGTATYLIYRNEEGRDWFVQAAEIVAEFCDEAIGLIERDGSCYMSWSG